MAHLTYSDFHSLLTKQKNKYVQGVLRINKRNRSDAYVTVDSLPEGDVYICGSKDRNRALEGDVVGIELIDPEELPQQKLEGNKDRKNSRRPEEVEDTGDADVDEVKPKYCGRVVSIVERSLSQMFSGTLTIQRPSGSTKKTERKKQDEEDQKDQPRIVWFKPTDKRVPLIAIPIDQAPEDFVENHVSYVHRLFVATIKRWPLSSLHPFGQLERELGDIGNIEIETEALLADNNVTTTPFGEKVEKCLPELPWTIPEKEVSRRRDLRNDCIFTIDPATAKDLDDAVSCTRLEDGTLEIGVHIADVSHFIKVGSALDREAKSRATTVYLVQKAIPMLPNVLCEDLCSLTANVDRLAFSVFWKMTEEGQILDTSFAKSVIRSCAQLSYDDAQRVIKMGSLDPKVEVVGHARSLVEDNIKTFFKLSQILRQKRFENGALSINSVKLSFETDEIHNPLSVSVYELKESNRLIEEFMLLANMSVAKQICEFFPDLALLRRHEQPLEKRKLDFISHMNKLGLDLDASSAGALQRSLDAIQDPDMRQVVRLLTIKTMNRAKYICSGMLNPDKYQHYSLNVPLYTHFTSPIRRYADIIVHRMLEASLVGDSKFYLTKESCQKSANHCNIKKDAAKLAQDQSSQVYLSVLLRNMTESEGMVVKDAIIVQVLDASFDVLVPEYGLEKRVYVDQLPLERHAWNGSSGTLKLYWTTEPFKTVIEEEAQETKADDKSRRLSTLSAARHVGAMDHPDDVTNAYEDERGLFDYESDDEDEDDVIRSKSNGAGADEDEDEDEGEGEDEARRLTRIRTFGHVSVLVTADTTVSPPAIKVIAMNPFSASADVPTAFA
ncbi:RNB-domain-containing protein [Dissophora ornata]|nr:RNB-domain-containing protein [Dissophora ornata]